MKEEVFGLKGLRWLGQAADVAEPVLLLTDTRASHIQGSAVLVDGGGTPGVH